MRYPFQRSVLAVALALTAFPFAVLSAQAPASEGPPPGYGAPPPGDVPPPDGAPPYEEHHHHKKPDLNRMIDFWMVGTACQKYLAADGIDSKTLIENAPVHGHTEREALRYAMKEGRKMMPEVSREKCQKYERKLVAGKMGKGGSFDAL